ncbi:mitochondrial protein [Xylogone sp. PMI_703]|nr:mitochondrial protein [Xylogone sp. PMI_703]
MSNRLSAPLKALIGSAHARPDTTPAPSNIKSVFENIVREANSKGIALPVWLSITTAASMTMNSPGSLLELHDLVTKLYPEQALYAAELIREVGLKCIGFNGVPRTINCLNTFFAGLPDEIKNALSTTATRALTPENISATLERGRSLWKSIYNPLDEKLADKLSQSHPDLSVYIIEGAYGCLFSDNPELPKPARVGRVLTSIVAVSCLRAQTGAGPQVISHVFGLRKAFQDGTYKTEEAEHIRGVRWLATDEGSIWLLQIIDYIVEAIGLGGGSTFAPGFPRKSKL